MSLQSVSKDENHPSLCSSSDGLLGGRLFCFIFRFWKLLWSVSIPSCCIQALTADTTVRLRMDCHEMWRWCPSLIMALANWFSTPRPSQFLHACRLYVIYITPPLPPSFNTFLFSCNVNSLTFQSPVLCNFWRPVSCFSVYRAVPFEN